MEDTVRQLLVDYQHERQTARAMLREVRESAPCDADPPASEEELDLFRSRYADALTEDLRTRERKTPLGYLKNALEYNSAIKELITATEELVLYQKGLEEQLLARTKICEERIAVVEAALGQSETDTDCTKVVVTQKEVAAAKAKFDVIKADLHKSIRSHYPDSTNDLMTFLQMLIQEKLQNNNYTAITSENFHIIRILKELNMLSSSPYDEMQIRIGCDDLHQHDKCEVIPKGPECFRDVQSGCVFAGHRWGNLRTRQRQHGEPQQRVRGYEHQPRQPRPGHVLGPVGLRRLEQCHCCHRGDHQPGNVPLSISLAVPLITALYVLMNVAYMTVLDIPEMISVPAVAVTFGDRVLGPASFLIPLGVAVATFGCAMSVQFGVTRVCYVAAREGHMVESFSYVNLKRMTPMPAVAFQGLLAALFIAVGDIKALIEFASFLLWFFYGLAMVSLLILRRTQAKKERPYKVPIVIPWFVLCVSIFLSILPIVHDPSLKYLFAVGFIVSGLAVYAVFVYYKRIPSAMKHFTFLTQVLFESVPPNCHQD